MDKHKPKKSKVSKIGPLFKVEGGIMLLHPFKTRPLIGYEEKKALKDEEPFLEHLSTISRNWFEDFPECCDTHKELKRLSTFNKDDFSFIPDQIVKNLKYFTYALEQFIDTENGFNEITDYIDYLIESFGMPEIGGYIFKQALKNLIEGVKLDDKEFTDDMRLDLLQHLEPKKPPIDLDERDIGLLYSTFQKWLNAMPNIGRFKDLKDRLRGKIPMNIFMIEPKFNKYIGRSSFRTRSRKELLEFLVKMTSDILNLSRSEIKKENYDKDKFITAAEERLRIQQDKLLERGHSDLEINYFELVESWLSIVIQFYQVLNQAIEEAKSSKLIDSISEVKSNINDMLSKIDEIQIEIATLCNSNKILKWLKLYLPKDSFKQFISEIESLSEDDEDSKKMLDFMISQLQSSGISDFKINGIEKKAKNPDLSIKHKLKLTIPLFLFMKYEGEIELSDKQKLPRSFKELKKLFKE